MRNCSDETIAEALELRVGLSLPWKSVGRKLNIDHKKLQRYVYMAMRTGMNGRK